MKQNLIKLAFDAERLNRLDSAIQTAENELADLISLPDDEIQGLLKMGGKTEPFCRKVIDVMAENPTVVPASFGLEEARADVAALDALRPRLRRLQKLVQRAEDTQIALGSDIHTAALEGYALLKATGHSEGLEAMRKELGARWKGRGRSGEVSAPAESLA
mgnify:CR=1 FL=1